jgi:predicted flap endonuclease-1-like 5' DNA nuclease
MRPVIAALLACVSLSLPASPAWAGHYRLPVEGLFAEGETAAFRKAGLDTTLALLNALAPTKAREQVARRTGISFTRLTLIAAEVDLLRVNGVGPSMVRLMQAAGIRHARDLGRAVATDLARRLEAANATQRIAPVTPNEDILRDWIGQAAALGAMVEGLP